MTKLRVGIGHDTHRLEEGRPLILGGVRIDHPRGLVGPLRRRRGLHAVADALLGAAGLGDIGEHYPTPTRGGEGVDSARLLAEVVDRVGQGGMAGRQLRRRSSTPRSRSSGRTSRRCGRTSPGCCGVDREARERQGQDRRARRPVAGARPSPARRSCSSNLA